jgi:DNA polymerase-3 subunit gamma/tau
MAVLYLKYRPQTLSDLIGQENVTQTLLNSFNNQRLSHAYLLVGPRGTGKTSTARILAKMVNCTGKEFPCNKCSSCVSITDGSNMDIIEIDAASNRGIDDIRSLRENIKLSPSESKKKIYIIDEVHMLTTEAFNALLKTLEEPPAHVMFILATTEAAKIPQTILSRVQRLDFNLASVKDLVKALQKVADSEKLKVDPEALENIAKAAQGSFRDGVKLLDQIASSNTEITAAVVNDSLKTGDFEAVLGLISALSEKNSNSALSQVVKLTQSGTNMKELTLSLMEILRNLIFIKSDLTALVKENFSEEKYKRIEEVANKFNHKDLTTALSKLQESLESLKTASIASLPLEIAVVEICQDASKVVNYASKEEVTVIPSEAVPAGRQEGIQLAEQSSVVVNEISVPQETIGTSDDKVSADVAKLHEKWTVILETIRPFNYSLEALLRGAKIIKADDGLVIFEVPYSFHQRILESPKSKDLMESVLAGILERPIRISTVLGARPARIEDIANVEMAADDEIINLASEIFNGKLID